MQYEEIEIEGRILVAPYWNLNTYTTLMKACKTNNISSSILEFKLEVSIF